MGHNPAPVLHMLDATVIRRDARACMMDWPVTIRHYYSPTQYHEIQAALSRADEISMLEPGGLLDQSSLSVYFITVDLTPLPLNRDRVDVRMRDNSWKTFEVKHTPDNYDPLAEFTELGLGSPND